LRFHSAGREYGRVNVNPKGKKVIYFLIRLSVCETLNETRG